MLMRHPCGNRVGRRAEDDLDSGLAHGVDDAVHPRIVELAVFGLPQAPGGLAHAHHVEAGGLHQGDVLVEAGSLVGPGHVLVVVGGAVEDGGKVQVGLRSARLGGLLRAQPRRRPAGCTIINRAQESVCSIDRMVRPLSQIKRVNSEAKNHENTSTRIQATRSQGAFQRAWADPRFRRRSMCTPAARRSGAGRR